MSEQNMDAVAGRLGERYTAEAIPPCGVCGRALRIQRAGGGEATVWGCDGLEDDPDNPGHLRRSPTYDPSDDHYGRSRWTQHRPGDADVLALLTERASLLERVAEARGVIGLAVPIIQAEREVMFDSNLNRSGPDIGKVTGEAKAIIDGMDAALAAAASYLSGTQEGERG